jgi:elongation factor P hydroxylase
VAKKRKRKKAPKGYHYMPDGKLMKNSAHKRKRK